MFNQTTPGWVHWSSLPDTAGFLDTAGLQTSTLRPQPPLSQHLRVLCHCMWWQSRFPMVVPACAKRTTSLITFRHHYIHWPQLDGLVLTPHTQECHKAPSSKCSSYRKQATDTETSSSPSARTWTPRTKQVFRDALKAQRSRGKVRRAQLTRCIERLQRGMQAQLMGWGSEIKVGSPGEAGL